jgi:polyhydroxyalkanoate synthesis regulator phasin
MNLNKKLAVAVSGAVLLMAGQFALADSTTDIVDALVSKGVLTEEEGKLISKGAKSKAAADEKAIKGKLSISNVLESANLYGNYRARYEYRQGENSLTEIERQRPRGKFELGVETATKNAYSDIAFVLGTAGRTDNFSVGAENVSTSTAQTKQAVTLKRAMFGYKVAPWLTVEAGIMKNPLYTTAMVWDADLSVGGFTEKFTFKTDGGTELFATTLQNFYGPSYRTLTTTKATNLHAGAHDSTMFANQIGANIPLSDKANAKVAATYYIYGGAMGSHGATTDATKFVPGLASSLTAYATTFANTTDGTSAAVNDLDILEIPAEFNYMVTSNHGLRVMGSYVYNFSGDDRARAADIAAGGGSTIYSQNVDDTSWMLGLAYGSAKDLKAFAGNKLSEGDWRVSAAYQSMGAFAQDPNLNDSDIFDSRLNTEGWVLRGQYNIEDNFFVNVTYADAKRKNNALATVTSAGQDISLNWSDFKLFQADVTYKF